jgi:hypothetical protein
MRFVDPDPGTQDQKKYELLGFDILNTYCSLDPDPDLVRIHQNAGSGFGRFSISQKMNFLNGERTHFLALPFTERKKDFVVH